MPPATKFKPRLPNRDSRKKTATSVGFELHYAHLGVIDRWDRERYDRLCLFVALTRYELASLILWNHGQVAIACERNVFPGPVAMLLTLFEAQVMHTHTKDVIKNPFPPSLHG